MLNQFMNDFNAWFDSIKGQLEGDIAVNLASQVTNLPALALIGAEVLANKDIVSAHLADDANIKHKAKEIGLSSPNFTSLNLDGVVNELFTNVSNGKALVGNAITGVDDSVVIPTEPSFGDLASAIGKISGIDIARGELTTQGTLRFADVSGGTKQLSYVQGVGLDFKPKLIIVYTSNRGAPFFSLYYEETLTISEGSNIIFGKFGGNFTTQVSQAEGLGISLSESAVVEYGGFVLPVLTGSSYQYVALNWRDK